MLFNVALAVTGVLSPRLREIARVKSGPEAEGWTELQAAMLRAADELHSDACISDDTWAVLAAHLNEQQLIEVPMLVGQYHIVSSH